MTRILELAGADGTTAVRIRSCGRRLLAALADDADPALSECPARKDSVRASFFAHGKLAAAGYHPALTSPRP